MMGGKMCIRDSRYAARSIEAAVAPRAWSCLRGSDGVADEPMGIPPKDRAQEGIRWYIHNAGLTGGDKLPSERVLSERLGVSRTALRAATTQLISMHVLESRQGSGTYVLPPKPINIFQETRNFSDAVRRVGREPGARLLDDRVVDADEVLAAKFDLAVGSRVFEVRRVR